MTCQRKSGFTTRGKMQDRTLLALERLEPVSIPRVLDSRYPAKAQFRLGYGSKSGELT
jgi:hypothetical protein